MVSESGIRDWVKQREEAGRALTEAKTALVRVEAPFKVAMGLGAVALLGLLGSQMAGHSLLPAQEMLKYGDLLLRAEAASLIVAWVGAVGYSAVVPLMPTMAKFREAQRAASV
jgi:hypothetical protein